MRSFAWPLVLGSLCFLPSPVFAQITPAADGTGTLVNMAGDRIDIGGGTLSPDGGNLFQSFQQFNVNAGQTANFLSQPSVQNILSRVVGGDPSYINGLLQVSGSNANLYLLNPAGIVFGQNARLNMNGDFFASTASQLGFANGTLEVLGQLNPKLQGDPQTLTFAASPGAIVQAGDLQVKPGQSINLVAGQVVHTGNLNAPGGNILIGAVPGDQGETLVRLSSPGSPLSWEIVPPVDAQGRAIPLTPPLLRQLLRGPNLPATGLVVDDGGVTLHGTTLPETAGMAIARGNLSSAGGQVAILGQKVALLNAQVSTAGHGGGGQILIGGDYQGLGNIARAQQTYVNVGSRLDADALTTGNGGKVIVWSDGQTRFFGHASAKGGTTGGNGGLVEISARGDLAFRGQADVIAPYGTSGIVLFDPQNLYIDMVNSTAAEDGQIADGQIFTGDGGGGDFTISLAALKAVTGNILLEASNNIELRANTAPSSTLNFTRQIAGTQVTLNAGNDILFKTLDTSWRSDLELGSITDGGGSLTLNAGNTIIFGSQIPTIITHGGSVTLTATNGRLDLSNTKINTTTTTGGGAIALTAQDMTAANSVLFSGGGNVTARATGGAITFDRINADSGNVTVTATGDLTITNGVSSQRGLSGLSGLSGSVLNIPLDGSTYQGGNLVLSGQNITIPSLVTGGGSITANATNNLRVNGITLKNRIDLQAGGNLLSSSALLNPGGTVNLTGNNVTASIIATTDKLARTPSPGGNVTITANNNAQAALIDTRSTNDAGGKVTVKAIAGDLSLTGNPTDPTTTGVLSTHLIDTSGGSGGGIVDLQAGGTIHFTPGLVRGVLTTGGTGGNFTAIAGQDLIGNGNFNLIKTNGLDRAVTLTARNGQIALGSTAIQNDIGGTVQASAKGDLTLKTITSSGGNLSLTSGGQLTLTNGISAPSLVCCTPAGIANPGSPNQGGNLTLQGQNISVLAAIVAGGTVNASASNHLSLSSITAGENLTLQAGGPLFANVLTTRGNVVASAGSTLAIGAIGARGTVDLTSPSDVRLFSFLPAEIGISNTSIGSQGGITIRHGGRGVVPFTVGQSVTSSSGNGSLGTLTTLSNRIDTGSFLPTTTVGNIRIISVPAAPPDVCSLTDCKPSTPPPLGNMGDRPPTTLNAVEIKEVLSNIERATGEKPALIYLSFSPTTVKGAQQPDSKEVNASADQAVNQLEAKQTANFATYLTQPRVSGDYPLSYDIDPNQEELTLVVVTSQGQPIRQRVAGVTRSQVMEVVEKLQRNITNVRRDFDYSTSEQLYQWLVTPLLKTLGDRQISNLIFIADPGLRGVPYAALYDGKQFLIEKYSVGLMPSMSLANTQYLPVKDLAVLAMGASTFASGSNPLPGVNAELDAIEKLWPGQAYREKQFTVQQLLAARAVRPFGIVHLATHGEFKGGDVRQAYIEFADQRLSFDQWSRLNLFNSPPVELLVLSACRTALGDTNAELGFAGLPAQTQVKSVLGSLWYVSDQGTLGLMTEFYDQLRKAPIKAEALRQAQLALLKGQVRMENGQLITPVGTVPLPADLQASPDQNFEHPYFWSSFTMIGSPW